MYKDIQKMSLCIWSIPGIGIKFYIGDTGNGKYGGNSKSVSGNRCYTAIGEYGRKQFFIYLSGHWNYFKCGKKCGATGRESKCETVSAQ